MSSLIVFNFRLTEENHNLIRKLAFIRKTSMAKVINQIISDFIKQTGVPVFEYNLEKKEKI